MIENNFYKENGIALYVKGEFKIGIHPDNIKGEFSHIIKDERIKITFKMEEIK